MKRLGVFIDHMARELRAPQRGVELHERAMTKIDEVLEQQLTAAGTNRVEAVVMLKSDDSSLVPTPEKTKGVADEVVQRARGKLGEVHDIEYNVFEHMGSFAISAPAVVIRYILAQPEIAGAIANQQQRGFAIKPVHKAAAS